MTGVPDGTGCMRLKTATALPTMSWLQPVEAPATGGSAPSNAGSVPRRMYRNLWSVPQPSRVKFREWVSVFQFDKDWNVVGGKNLIDTAKDSTGTYELDTKVVPTSIQRRVKPLASTASALATSMLRGGPVWFAPEETGPDGRGWATPDGTAKPSKDWVATPECAYSQADDSDTTVLLSPEDFADGELYMFKGKPQTIPMALRLAICMC